MSGNMIGKVFDNRYELTECIGVGGMAEVYQAQDRVLGRRVAVKVMLPQYANDREFTQRFRQEAAAAANLQSPFIVNVYDWGQDGGTYYIVMEYVRGSDLKTAIKQRGAINQRKVAEIGAQVCQALSVAHNQDIVHRDIKPQNIMVQPDGNVKVMDFGIARAKNSVMSKTSAVLGTAHYISPEQAQGKELTAASDIYSLGVVLYEAATGVLPFDGPDSVSVAMKQVSEQPIPPTQVNPSVDPSLESIILRAMQKDAGSRFTTVGDMKHALNDFLAGKTVRVNDEPTRLMSSVYDYDEGYDYDYDYDYDYEAGGVHADDTTVMSAVAGAHEPSPSGNMAPRTMVAEDAKFEARRKRRRNVIITLVVLAALAAVAAGVYSWLNRTEAVPDVTGLSVDKAMLKLRDEGFEIGTQTEVFSNNVSAGMIVSTDPQVGSHVAPGAVINLNVSKGRDQVAVPDLAGMNAQQARDALTAAGLKANEGAALHSDTVPAEIVLSQNPLAGSMIDRGATVTFVLSLGIESVAVPNVMTQDEETATNSLRNAGFDVEVLYDSSKSIESGKVMAQQPQSGEQLPKGSKVTITISTGISKHTVTSSVVDATGAQSTGATVTLSNETVQDGEAVSFWINAQNGYDIVSVADSNGNDYSGTTSGMITNITHDTQLIVTVKKEEKKPSSSSSSSSPSGGGNAGGGSDNTGGNTGGGSDNTGGNTTNNDTNSDANTTADTTNNTAAN